MKHESIVIVDYGSQYTQLIARRIRSLGVYTEIISSARVPEYSFGTNVRGIVLSGSPRSVTQDDFVMDERIYTLGVPILGICFGMQAMSMHFGGMVNKCEAAEYGSTQIVLRDSPLWEGVSKDDSDQLEVWMSHEDCVTVLPDGFINIASSNRASIAAMMHKTEPWYGVQFHPEVTHTGQGEAVLAQFALTICDCSGDWRSSNVLSESLAAIRDQVGDESVLLALSGGVDSSVLAVLLHRAIGNKLTCVFVDTGLLRQGESDQVMETVADHMDVNVIRVDARAQFFEALAGVDDPEAKRKICGRLFVEIFQEQALQLSPKPSWLAQGTIYPDVIESAGSESAHNIKSHHNVGGLPETLSMKVLEPLRMLFKDEVRDLGKSLGLPDIMINRHPFPGPGLAIRVLGNVTEEAVTLLQACDMIFLEELRRSGWYDKVAQAFAVYLPVNSVGVVGDQRRYAPVIGLRAVQTADFMTVTWANLPYDLLSLISNRIVNEVSGVSRVVYDVTGKPPATIEWE